MKIITIAMHAAIALITLSATSSFASESSINDVVTNFRSDQSATFAIYYMKFISEKTFKGEPIGKNVTDFYNCVQKAYSSSALNITDGKVISCIEKYKPESKLCLTAKNAVAWKPSDWRLERLCR